MFPQQMDSTGKQDVMSRRKKRKTSGELETLSVVSQVLETSQDF